MRQALWLQHADFEGPGIFRASLSRHRYDVRTCLVPAEGLPSNPADFLLIMGGPMSANDSEPWIIKEIEFITHTVTRGVAVLGVCLGAQLLAKGLGAPVKPGPRVELGPMPITVTQEGQGIQYLAPSQRPLRCFNDMVKDLTSRRVLSLWPHLSCMPLRPFDLALGCMVFSFISSWKQRGSKRYAENAPTLCTTVAPPQNCCFQRGPQSCPSRMNGLID